MEFDAWYAVVGNNLQLASSGAAVWVLWPLFIFMYMGILYYLVNIKYGKCNVNVSCVTSNMIVTVLGINFGLYLLSNTSFPLYSYYDSDTINVPVAWIVMHVLNLMVVITAIALLMVNRCLTKTQQVPHALGPDSEQDPLMN